MRAAASAIVAAIVAVIVAVIAAGCGGGTSHRRDVTPIAPDGWCRLAPGAYAFMWAPSTLPALAGPTCAYQRAEERGGANGARPPASTLAELVVEPGGTIEIPVTLPPGLDGMGCVLDSVVIAHGERAADLSIAIRTGDTVIPIAHYAQMPPPYVALGLSARLARAVVHDTPPPITSSVTPAVSPTPAPGPPPPPPPAPPLPDLDDIEIGLEVGLGPWTAGATLTVDGERPMLDQTATVRVLDPPAVVPAAYVSVRHPIGIDAPDELVIVLSSATQPFGLAVRSDSESSDPPLSFRDPGAAAAVPTHLVPQAVVVLTHCGRRASTVLEDLL